MVLPEELVKGSDRRMRDNDEDYIADHGAFEEISVQERAQSRTDTCTGGSNLLFTEANTTLSMESPREKGKRKKKRCNKNMEASSDSRGKVNLKKRSSPQSADLASKLEAVKDAKVNQDSSGLSHPERQDPLGLGCCQKRGKRKEKRHLGIQKLPQDVQCTTFSVENGFVEDSLDLAVDGTTSDQYNVDLNSGVPTSNEENSSKEFLCHDTEREKNRKKRQRKRRRKKLKRAQQDPDDFQEDDASIRTGSAEGTCTELGADSVVRADEHPLEPTHGGDSANTKTHADLGLGSFKVKRKRKRGMRQTTDNTVVDLQGDALMNEVQESSVNDLRADRKKTEDQDASQLNSFMMGCNKTVSVNKICPVGDISEIGKHALNSSSGLIGTAKTIMCKRKERISLPCQKPLGILEAIAEPSLMINKEPGFSHSCDKGVLTEKSASSCANNDSVEVQKSIMAEVISDCLHSDLATKKSKETVKMVNVVGRSVGPFAFHPNKKLLVLDINGLLADIIHGLPFSKSVFGRPFCSDFLYFCFEKFNVGVWSSRAKKNLDKIIPFIFKSYRPKLLFCWNASHCTKTGFNTVEKKGKPLVLKELRKLWENQYSDLPWNKGVFNETNTLLLDDSPYKALRNPVHTAIFPYPYHFKNKDDSSLGPGGDIREYLEGLADAENVQDYVSNHPFGQKAITDSNAHWSFYSKIVGQGSSSPEGRRSGK